MSSWICRTYADHQNTYISGSRICKLNSFLIAKGFLKPEADIAETIFASIFHMLESQVQSLKHKCQLPFSKKE